MKPRDHFVYVHSQWEMALHCIGISRWLDAHTKWSLEAIKRFTFLILRLECSGSTTWLPMPWVLLYIQGSILTYWPQGDVAVIVKYIYKLTVQHSSLGTCCEITLRWMPQNTFDKSILVQVRAWCPQAIFRFASLALGQSDDGAIRQLRSLLLTWINFNLSMDM